MHLPYSLAHLVQQASGLQWRDAGFHGKFIAGCLSDISTATQVASHLKYLCMSSIWSSGQPIEQVLLWTLR